MRTDLTSPIDGALSNRNAGALAFWEVARSGNGDMRTDLLADDGRDYEELDGIGESTEEMTAAESSAEDRGDKSVFKQYRETLPGETPPYAPKKGKAWIRRRMRMNSRRPGGNRMARVRWAQVSPQKWAILVKQGQVMNKATSMNGVGFIDMSNPMMKWVLYGGIGLLGVGVLLKLAAKRRAPAALPAA